MRRTAVIMLGTLLYIGAASLSEAQYAPTWESLDARPLPAWYDEAKIGIFIHWGVFSVPSFGSEWFWHSWVTKNPAYVEFMEKNYRPGFTYQDFAAMFTAEFYNPVAWADIFNASGAKYVVLTSKHHEGYTNWPSKVSWNWNSMDVGPKRDLVGELATAIRTVHPHLHFGLYHSLFEWYNPLFLQDKSNGFQTNHFVKTKTMPELMELVTKYKPEVIWSDGDEDATDQYWNSTTFLAWLFNDSPVSETVVVNDRWGKGDACKHGSFYTCSDRYNPGVAQPHKWENCMTLDKRSWGYRRNAPATDYLTIHDLITILAETISCGGNLLVNIGPTHDGMIPAIMEANIILTFKEVWKGLQVMLPQQSRVRGRWAWVLKMTDVMPAMKSDKATSRWDILNKFTSSGGAVYGIVLHWPQDDLLTLASVSSTASTSITMLGDSLQEVLKPTSILTISLVSRQLQPR
ncbi:alpha-L-fucosidase [Hyalella azteca]|uniref:Putative alpha-L-fucosidase n=1 Tax=Hyalella azteca TaxID=294128 RepID=A0A979FJF1_HYAAZ|nr:alpha-L-fucosidase [Hyalella azteca]